MLGLSKSPANTTTSGPTSGPTVISQAQVLQELNQPNAVPNPDAPTVIPQSQVVAQLSGVAQAPSGPHQSLWDTVSNDWDRPLAPVGKWLEAYQQVENQLPVQKQVLDFVHKHIPGLYAFGHTLRRDADGLMSAQFTPSNLATVGAFAGANALLSAADAVPVVDAASIPAQAALDAAEGGKVAEIVDEAIKAGQEAKDVSEATAAGEEIASNSAAKASEAVAQSVGQDTPQATEEAAEIAKETSPGSLNPADEAQPARSEQQVEQQVTQQPSEPGQPATQAPEQALQQPGEPEQPSAQAPEQQVEQQEQRAAQQSGEPEKATEKPKAPKKASPKVPPEQGQLPFPEPSLRDGTEQSLPVSVRQAINDAIAKAGGVLSQHPSAITFLKGAKVGAGLYYGTRGVLGAEQLMGPALAEIERGIHTGNRQLIGQGAGDLAGALGSGALGFLGFLGALHDQFSTRPDAAARIRARFTGDQQIYDESRIRLVRKLRGMNLSPEMNEAIKFYMNAGGSEEQLADWAQKIKDSENITDEVKERALKAIDIALHDPSGAVKGLADQLHSALADVHQEGIDEGVFKPKAPTPEGEIEEPPHYLPQEGAWLREQEGTDADQLKKKKGNGRRVLRSFAGSTLRRIFPTYADGILAGMTPSYESIPDLMDNYLSRTLSRIAAVRAIKAFGNLRTKDGRPVFGIPGGMGRNVNIDDGVFIRGRAAPQVAVPEPPDEEDIDDGADNEAADGQPEPDEEEPVEASVRSLTPQEEQEATQSDLDNLPDLEEVNKHVFLTQPSGDKDGSSTVWMSPLGQKIVARELNRSLMKAGLAPIDWRQLGGLYTTRQFLVNALESIKPGMDPTGSVRKALLGVLLQDPKGNPHGSVVFASRTGNDLDDYKALMEEHTHKFQHSFLGSKTLPIQPDDADEMNRLGTLGKVKFRVARHVYERAGNAVRAQEAFAKILAGTGYDTGLSAQDQENLMQEYLGKLEETHGEEEVAGATDEAHPSVRRRLRSLKGRQAAWRRTRKGYQGGKPSSPLAVEADGDGERALPAGGKPQLQPTGAGEQPGEQLGELTKESATETPRKDVKRINLSAHQIKRINEMADRIVDTVNKTGGATYHPTEGDMFGRALYAMGGLRERAQRITGPLNSKEVARFIKENWDVFKNYKNAAVGAWKDPQGVTHLEVSVVHPDERTLLDAAHKSGEYSIFNLKKGVEIRTGGTGGLENPLPQDQGMLGKMGDYNIENGRGRIHGNYLTVAKGDARKLVDAYNDLKSDPDNPANKRSYDSLKRDIQSEWEFIHKKLGVKLEERHGEQEPYESTEEMQEDVRNNKHLFYDHDKWVPEDHPLAAIDPQTGVTYNDMLQAENRLLGHVIPGNRFTPAGDENAWFTHQQMLHPASRPAAATELRALQFARSDGLRGDDGRFLRPGDEGYVPPEERHMVVRKAGLLPTELQSRGELDHYQKLGVDQYNPATDIRPFLSFIQELVPEEQRSVVRAALKAKVNPDESSWKAISPFLDKDAAENVEKAFRTKVLHSIHELGDIRKYAEAAKAGSAARGWYSRAAFLIKDIFGSDADVFANIVASMSPQKPVDENFAQALRVYGDWVEAGRPMGTPDHPVENLKGIIPHGVIKTIREDLERIFSRGDITHGPKRANFYKNLTGDLNYITKDRWMAAMFGWSPGVWGNDATREAADTVVRSIGKKVGMLPAEVQESGWSFLRTALTLARQRSLFPDMMSDSGRDISGLGADEILRGITDNDIKWGGSEFTKLIEHNTKVRDALNAIANKLKRPELRPGAIEGTDAFKKASAERLAQESLGGGASGANPALLKDLLERAATARGATSLADLYARISGEKDEGPVSDAAEPEDGGDATFEPSLKETPDDGEEEKKLRPKFRVKRTTPPKSQVAEGDAEVIGFDGLRRKLRVRDTASPSTAAVGEEQDTNAAATAKKAGAQAPKARQQAATVTTAAQEQVPKPTAQQPVDTLAQEKAVQAKNEQVTQAAKAATQGEDINEKGDAILKAERQAKKTPKKYVSLGDYRTIDDKAMRGWKFVGKTPDGLPILIENDLKVHPEVYQHLKRFLDTGESFQHGVPHMVLHLTSIMKNVKLLPAYFHFMNVGLRAAFEEHNIKGLQMLIHPPEYDPESPDVKLLLHNSLMLHDEGGASEEGLESGSYWEKVLRGRKVFGHTISDKESKIIGRLTGSGLFGPGGFVPKMKVAVALDDLERLTKDHPEMNRADAAWMVARHVNDLFGLVNWRAIGASATTMNIARLTAFAPDFLGAELRLYGRALAGEHLARNTIIATALAQFVATRVANSIVGLVNDPQKTLKNPLAALHLGTPFSVVGPSGDFIYRPRTLITDALNVAQEPSRFLTSRINPLVDAGRALLGSNYNGRPIEAGQRLKAVANALAPMGAESLVGTGPSSSVTDSLLRTIGVDRMRQYTPAQKTALKLAAETFAKTDENATETDQHAEESKLIDGLRSKANGGLGNVTPAQVRQAYQQGKITPQQLRTIFRAAAKPMLPEIVERLDAGDAMKVFAQANPMERRLLIPTMGKKMMKLHEDAPEEYSDLEPEYQAIVSGNGVIPVF